MVLRVARRRLLAVTGVGVVTFLCLYYYITLDPPTSNLLVNTESSFNGSTSLSTSSVEEDQSNHESCEMVLTHVADTDTTDVFQELEMLPAWMERREYWSNDMEDRFQRRKPMWGRLPLKVIVMPHSHTDPGWLKTMEGYFATATKNIINNVVNKLTEHKNMTFILTEMSFLSMWWEAALPDMRTKLRNLLISGRLEIPTGGWVMTDEANVDLFSMIDQLVEGHGFLREMLGVIPKASWSVDSFGHGGTFPHLLAKAGIDNMVIMRVHFAWKEWFARNQAGEFLWKQPWEKDGSGAPLCHNFPYDIYSIKHSCGPSPQTCLGFDFRHVKGEYNEFSAAYTPIDAANLKTRAELLLEQYGRTGSLLPHNVVLVPLGDDFRYNLPDEFDQQYNNYIQIMQYINSNDYHAEVSFGTLSDYFKAVRERQSKFATLSGDFFVYSDIFSEGQPAYWSGYYSTRPFLKLLSRQVASKLRATEILFTLATDIARGDPSGLPIAVLSSLYPELVEARRHLGLFQHHDAITGTSKSFVMQDYQQKLQAALGTTLKLTEVSAQFLLQQDQSSLDLSRPLRHIKWRDEQGEERLSTLDLHTAAAHNLLLYNSLAREREDLIQLRTNSASVCVRDEEGNLLDTQVAPHFNSTGQPKLDFGLFDVWFRATLPPLSLSTFVVTFCDRSGDEFEASNTKVYCMRCPDSSSQATPYSLHRLPEGSLKLENHMYSLLFHPTSWLLASVTNKLTGKSWPLELEFTAYPSAPFRSGAYLFSVDQSTETAPVFSEKDLSDIVILSGPVFAQVSLVWRVLGEGGVSSFLHTIRLQHTTGPQGEAVQIENLFDFGPPPNMRDTELVMRLNSGLETGKRFYTDKSGLGFMRREWKETAGLEGNFFPITQATFLQANNTRLSLLVTHAMAAASVVPGSLEVMLDRRTVYDDARGMGEGVTDSRATMHKFWLLLEPRDPDAPSQPMTLPALSPLASTLAHQLEHPPQVLHATRPNTLGLQTSLSLLQSPLPCDFHLLNLRSWDPRKIGDPQALLILQRQAPDCAWASLSLQDCRLPSSSPSLAFPRHSATFAPVSLTGNHPVERQGGLFTLQPIELVAYNVTFA